MNGRIREKPLPGSRDPERLIRALSSVGRLPLMRYLGQPRSEGEVQREFPGVPTVEIRRSVTQLEASQWIRGHREPMAEIAWSIDSETVEFLRAWILGQLSTAVPAHGLCATQLEFELVVFRRQSCMAVLKALTDGMRTHRDVVAAIGLQSGTVSDAIGRLQLATIIDGYRPVHRTRLHLLRFLVDLLGK